MSNVMKTTAGDETAGIRSIVFLMDEVNELANSAATNAVDEYERR